MLKLASPVACTYGKSCVTNLLHGMLFSLSYLCVEVGIARWLTPTNPSPRSMHSSTLLRGQVDFCNKYMSSLWIMWVHGYTHTHPSTFLATLMPRNFRRYHAPIIYLPQNSHHTYLFWHFHSHSEIYCHATFHHSFIMTRSIIVILLLHDHVADIVFVAKPPCTIFHTCHSSVIAYPGTPPEAFI